MDHTTLFVLISACCVDMLDIVHQHVSTKEKRPHFHLANGAFGTYALGCAVFDATCYGATVGETEQDLDENDIEYVVAFSIKSLEGFAALDGRATKTVSGFTSNQPVADQAARVCRIPLPFLPLLPLPLPPPSPPPPPPPRQMHSGVAFS